MNGLVVIRGALERLAIKAALAVGGSYYEPCELTEEHKDSLLAPVLVDIENTADIIQTIAESQASQTVPIVARAVVFDSRKNNKLVLP